MLGESLYVSSDRRQLRRRRGTDSKDHPFLVQCFKKAGGDNEHSAGEENPRASTPASNLRFCLPEDYPSSCRRRCPSIDFTPVFARRYSRWRFCLRRVREEKKCRFDLPGFADPLFTSMSCADLIQDHSSGRYSCPLESPLRLS